MAWKEVPERSPEELGPQPHLVLCEGEESDVLADARRLREAIFVEGQDIPVEDEQDGLDGMARHGVLYEGDEPIGVVRLRDLGDYGGKKVKIERVGVLEEHRRKGHGERLMRLVEAVVRNEYPGQEIVLNAQEEVVEWYEGQDYEAIGEPFEIAGIMHRKMTKRP